MTTTISLQYLWHKFIEKYVYIFLTLYSKFILKKITSEKSFKVKRSCRKITIFKTSKKQDKSLRNAITLKTNNKNLIKRTTFKIIKNQNKLR